MPSSIGGGSTPASSHCYNAAVMPRRARFFAGEDTLELCRRMTPVQRLEAAVNLSRIVEMFRRAGEEYRRRRQEQCPSENTRS
ncbi:MAG: hypothetical protein Kow001_01580 [Acidobacteriota bacterium]